MKSVHIKLVGKKHKNKQKHEKHAQMHVEKNALKKKMHTCNKKSMEGVHYVCSVLHLWMQSMWVKYELLFYMLPVR